MIEDYILVFERNPGGKQVANGTNNACGGEISLRIIVSANNQNTKMVAPHLNNEVMQIPEVPGDCQ